MTSAFKHVWKFPYRRHVVRPPGQTFPAVLQGANGLKFWFRNNIQVAKTRDIRHWFQLFDAKRIDCVVSIPFGVTIVLMLELPMYILRRMARLGLDIQNVVVLAFIGFFAFVSTTCT